MHSNVRKIIHLFVFLSKKNEITNYCFFYNRNVCKYIDFIIITLILKPKYFKEYLTLGKNFKERLFSALLSILENLVFSKNVQNVLSM